MRLVPSDRSARSTNPTVTDDAHAMRISHLKDRIARSEYTVDAHAVAEALLRRQGLIPPSKRRHADDAPAGHPPLGTAGPPPGEHYPG